MFAPHAAVFGVGEGAGAVVDERDERARVAGHDEIVVNERVAFDGRFG
jgi:hypothetical protein